MEQKRGVCEIQRGQEGWEKHVPRIYGHNCANCVGAERAGRSWGRGCRKRETVLVGIGREDTQSAIRESAPHFTLTPQPGKQHPHGLPYREQQKGKWKSRPDPSVNTEDAKEVMVGFGNWQETRSPSRDVEKEGQGRGRWPASLCTPWGQPLSPRQTESQV